MAVWRRIRGLAGVTLTWAVAWAAAGAAVLGIFLAAGWLRAAPTAQLWVLWEATFALCGALAGLAFGFTVMGAGRSRRLNELSLPKFATWGAVAGAAIPVLGFLPALARQLPGAASLLLLTAVGGALIGAALGTLALAMARGVRRRVIDPDDASELLEEGSRRAVQFDHLARTAEPRP